MPAPQIFGYRAIITLLLALVTFPGCGGGGSSGGTGGGGGGGGGGGNAVTIQYVEPSKVMLGVEQGLVTLAGTNFTDSSTVLFDGAAVPTFGSSSTSLQFQVPDSALSSPQSHSVQVSDPTNGKSNTATFDVYSAATGPALFNGQLTQYMSEALIVNSLVQDLNGDGRSDLILVTLDQQTSLYVPVIRYGQPDGTFSASTPLVPFNLPLSVNMVVAGDFNGDGHTDLMLIGYQLTSKGGYQVLLNDGTGHFTMAGSGVLPQSSSFAPGIIGDFNHDGKLDFVFPGSANGQAFSLYLGNGDGTFSAPVGFGASTGGQAVLTYAADFNNDGYTDLVYIDVFYNSSNQIRLLLSGPGGSYTDTPLPGVSRGTLGLAVGDFNNDHIPDLFVVDPKGMGRAYLGTGDGNFNPTGTPIFASDGYFASTPFVTADFDHDGNTDIATRTQLSGPDEILFLWGDGEGNFTSQSIISDHSFTLQVGDVNGDGIADIFAGVDQGFAYPSVVLGQNGRNFPSAQPLFPNTWGYLSTGDVFHDGYNDLLVGGVDNNCNPNVPGNIYHVQPNGTFASEGQAPGYATVLVDLNGDGIPDMVGFCGEEMLIWKGDGSGIFQAPINTISLPIGFGQFVFRDMDGDGHMDIVLPGVILYGQGNFQFDAVTWDLYQNFVVGDFDGDGIPDIATGSGILFGQGNRSFSAPTGSSPLPDNYPAFPTQVVADLNGDGKDDLVLANGGLDIYLSLGRQGFALDQALMVNGYAAQVTSLAVADLNADGLPDIAAGMLSGGEEVILFTNDGTGKYLVTTYTTGVPAVNLVAVDLNRDGKPDLAFMAYTTDFLPPTVTVLMHK
jgi:uncharacterized protein (TIGR03437 family)